MDLCRYGISLQVFNLISHEWVVSQRVRYKVEHKKRYSISTSNHVLCSLYGQSDNNVFDDFQKISDHLPKISEESQKLLEGLTYITKYFPKISDDNWRLPNTLMEDLNKLFQSNTNKLSNGNGPKIQQLHQWSHQYLWKIYHPSPGCGFIIYEF